MSRPPLDLSLYLVTDTAQCGGPDGVVRTVREAVDAGVTVVQLRDPDATDDAFVALGRALVEAIGGRVPLLLNDRVHLVAAIGADGAHVGQHDLDVRHARDMLGPDALLGLSAATDDELARAKAAGADVIDYLGVGAFRDTATKPDAPPAGGLDLVRRVTLASPWPVVMIGGIKAADLPAIRAAGADGVAVVSAICGQPDVTAATGTLLAHWNQEHQDAR